ncbi:aminoglycoside adenylyltransferase family protein [Methylocaldum marinum]|nr:aminoglycoside adenylyltransferase family protein [Methylocaldum marinum]
MTSKLNIPREASDALGVVQGALGRSVVAIYLFGSAVVGGLRPKSDVDVLAIVDRRLSEATRHMLVEELMRVSGRVGNDEGRRPLELTVLCLLDIVPWRYPPKHQLVCGEWLRDDFENRRVPAPGADPDLAIVLKKVRDSSVRLVGPEASAILDRVPMADICRAMQDSLPGLLSGVSDDVRNVLLTLARMWYTAVEGEISPKDVAAEWAVPRLHGGEASLLELARRGYVVECADSWTGKEADVAALVRTLKHAVQSSLAAQR